MTRSALPASLQGHLDAITASIGSTTLADWQERIVRQIRPATLPTFVEIDRNQHPELLAQIERRIARSIRAAIHEAAA